MQGPGSCYLAFMLDVIFTLLACSNLGHESFEELKALIDLTYFVFAKDFAKKYLMKRKFDWEYSLNQPFSCSFNSI